MYQIAAKVGSVFQNPRTQFFNVDTDSEIAFGIENEARPPQKLDRASRRQPTICVFKSCGTGIFLNCPAVKSRKSPSLLFMP